MARYLYKEYGPTILRIVLGLFFIITGLMKLTSPDVIIGMLTNLGFPAPVFFGWVVLLSEIIFGSLVLIGWKPEISVLPLVVILLAAIFTVHISLIGTGPMAMINLMFHITGIAALVNLALTGPGELAVTNTRRH